MTRSQIAFACLPALGALVILIWLTHTPGPSPSADSSGIGTVPETADTPRSQLQDRVLRSATFEVKLSASSVTAAGNKAQTDTKRHRCNRVCRQFVDAFQGSDRIIDWQRAPSNSLVAELLQNPGLRVALASIAIEASSDKRRFIIAAFSQLDPESQRALGRVLSQAPEKNQRLDGVYLLANPSNINSGVAKWFVNRLDAEQDVYVRGALVKALNQPDAFVGSANVVEALSRVQLTDTDDTVRGEALLAITRLMDNPEGSLSDSLAAIRSGSSELQHYGVLALEQIVTRQTLYGMELEDNVKSQIGELMNALMSSEFDEMPADIRKDIDKLYSRFF